MKHLLAGAEHPQRDAVLEWARLANKYHEGWKSLTDADHQILIHNDQKQTTPALQAYRQKKAKLDAVYLKQLRPGELVKITRALAELRTWLDGR